MKQKISIAVLFGGQSSEHEVSCKSAAHVLRNLSKEKYDIYALGITSNGNWMLTDASPEAIAQGNWEQREDNICAVLSPDAAVKGIITATGKVIGIDVCFPILHGKNGEDGTLAALCQLAGIPQVGCSMTAGANCMDKVLTKIICDRAGIKQAAWTFYYKKQIDKDADAVVEDITRRFALPVFVKPASAGSSVGVSKASDAMSLKAALLTAAEHDGKILIEENIVGQEIEVAVLDAGIRCVSGCGEIAPTAEFYDYDAKYNDETSRLFLPARLSEDLAQKVREVAETVFDVMECKGMSRVDFFVTADGEIIFNEINTIPGMTQISMYPKLLAFCGYEDEKLMDALIEGALQ